MRTPAQRLRAVRIFAAAVAAVSALAGCASTERREAHNGPQCRQFGLPPGSSAYADCVDAGPDAYSESHPLTGGHWCRAPASSPEGRCPGCSVNCGDQVAYCTRGREMWLDSPDACVRPAACECTQ